MDILAEFESKYNLSRLVICSVIEEVFSIILSEKQKRTVLVFLNNDEKTNELILEYIFYAAAQGDIKQYNGRLNRINQRDVIIKNIEFCLLRESVLFKAKNLAHHVGEIRLGTIRRIDDDNTYHVDIEIIPGEIITGSCLLRHQIPHERGYFSIEVKKMFNICSIYPIVSGEVPRLQVKIDRTSKSLVEKLIINKLPENQYRYTKIKCVKRVAGSISIIEASRRIPRDIILYVGEELKEKIKVVF